MDPVSALIAGGATLIGGYMNSQQSGANTAAQIQAQAQMQGQSEQYNAQQAGINREFQAEQVNQQDAFQQSMVANQQAYETQMSNTAYQRAANDMKRAGLNPMMMFGSGSAAGTPQISAPSGASASGSSASVGTPTVPLSQRQSPFGAVGQAVSSAIDASVRSKYIDKMSSEIGATQATADLTEARKDAVRQDIGIREPDARASMIRMGYPDWLASTLTYGHDLSKGAGELGDAFWSIVPGGSALKQLLFGGSAKGASGGSVSGGNVKVGPSDIQDIARRVDNLRGNSAKSRVDNDVSKILDSTGSKSADEHIGKLLEQSSGPGYSGSGRDFGFVGDGR